MKLKRLINWIKRLFGYHEDVDEVNYDHEELPQHVKEFMEKRLDDK